MNQVIAAGNLSGDTGEFVCWTGCERPGQTLSSVQVYCTDYSVSNNWMVGERSYVAWLPHDVVTASFTGGDWVELAHPPLVSGRSAAWELRVTFNFNTTSRPSGNASPVSKMSPIINMFHGCHYSIQLPTVDPDGDRIRCRWASASLRECSDVCTALPGAALDEERCILSYNATGAIGVYAVAIQVWNEMI